MNNKIDWTAIAEGLETGKQQDSKEWKDAQQIWNSSRSLGKKQGTPKVDMSQMMAKMQTRLNEPVSDEADHDEFSETKIVSLKPTKYLKYAASVAIVCMLSFVAYYIANDTTSGQLADTNIVKENTDTAPQQLTLADGTTINLEKGAKISYPEAFNGNKRVVKLAGNAFFDVARDEAKPFSIQMAKGKVQVLGTSFQLNAQNEFIELAVKTGKVRFSDETDSKVFFLTAGETAYLDAKSQTLTKKLSTENKEGAPTINWQKDQIVFKAMPLKDALDFVASWKGLSIKFGDNVSKEEQMKTSRTRVATDSSIDKIFSNLLGTTELKIHKDGNNIIIK